MRLLLSIIVLSCTFACSESFSFATVANTTPTPTLSNMTNASPTPAYFHCGEAVLPCSATVTGNLLLMFFYGIILAAAAKLISDGAELLLDLGLPASVVGGLILPVLGAVPDAAIIVVSGASGSAEKAQNSLQVGMGTLAGSTIMLLTLPWLGSLILGRNDIGPNGEAQDETGYGKFSFTKQVVIFSDPMCDVLTELTNPANKSHIPIRAFYVSFVVTPLCSNASELLSSLIFAMKKKKVNISMTYAQLYGAASMNNTLCLAIFMALVYFRNLKWEYSAEVFVIILVEFAVGALGFRKTYRVWLGIPVALLYFISIGLVAFLESSVIGWK